jgi:hypothetical protein
MPVALVVADATLAETPWGACGSQDFSQVNPAACIARSRQPREYGTPEAGPGHLYAPLAVAPQLQNTGPWNAAPILISGSSAYRSGEFLYQDFIYDDSGAIRIRPIPPSTGQRGRLRRAEAQADERRHRDFASLTTR